MPDLTTPAARPVPVRDDDDDESVLGELIVDFGQIDAGVLARYEETGEMDAVDLLDLDLPEMRVVVPGLLVEGTTILAAPPKIGKSLLIYQMCAEVALGGELLGRKVEQGDVLYLALEDGKRRGQDRARAALRGRRLPRGRMTVRWAAPPIAHGLEEMLVTWLDEHPAAALVAIDTLQKVRPGGDGRRNAYEVDVEDMGRLQAIMADRHVALLVVHHTRKDTAGDDFLAAVSGTYGVTGSADHTLLLRRRRAEKLGKLFVTGRELEEVDLPVKFDFPYWEAAPGELPGASYERRAVYEVVRDHGPIFPAAIAQRLKVERTAVQHLLAALLDEGVVQRTQAGYVGYDTTAAMH